jgi:hypothetical protein
MVIYAPAFCMPQRFKPWLRRLCITRIGYALDFSLSLAQGRPGKPSPQKLQIKGRERSLGNNIVEQLCS